MKKDPKTTLNTTESTDSSVEILSVTPLKTNEMKTIDKKIKKYGMLLDTGEGMGRRKQVVKPYDPFAVVDHELSKVFGRSKEFEGSSEFISYYNGILPKCERTHKRFGVDVDDAYVVLKIKNVHWIALAISILQRTIEVYDSSLVLSEDDEITEFVKPYAMMIPHLIRSLAFPTDQKALSDAEYTIIRYMEARLCDANIKYIRKKLAADMFAEGNHFDDL
ncbi:hypothetical protein Bca52824_027181 [Brassica carinata]|uniref:Ubiquitin-like protease family profile domain-containing protein n=1 Tax=Brassica carinata TaxID=52824 RepID=A0A8X7SHY8_BRACI|nr:hypothetical protein Bca52824_027181 [Brassica carinata]